MRTIVKILIVSLYALSFCSASFWFQDPRPGVQGLNPLDDPIYVPEAPQSADSEPTPDTRESTDKSIDNPMDKYRDKTIKTAVIFHVPRKCVNYDRQWDFHLGYPDEYNPSFGWISQLGYARDMFRDLNLNQVNVVYSLVSLRFKSEAKLRSYLPFAHYLEISCHPQEIFNAHYKISFKMNPRYTLGRVIGVNLIFNGPYEDAFIQILMDRYSKRAVSFYNDFREELQKDFPNISSDYIPYVMKAPLEEN